MASKCFYLVAIIWLSLVLSLGYSNLGSNKGLTVPARPNNHQASKGPRVPASGPNTHLASRGQKSHASSESQLVTKGPANPKSEVYSTGLPVPAIGPKVSSSKEATSQEPTVNDTHLASTGPTPAPVHPTGPESCSGDKNNQLCISRLPPDHSRVPTRSRVPHHGKVPSSKPAAAEVKTPKDVVVNGKKDLGSVGSGNTTGAVVHVEPPNLAAYRVPDNVPPPVVSVGGRLLPPTLDPEPDWAPSSGTDATHDFVPLRPSPPDYRYDEDRYRVPVVRVESRLLGDTMPNMPNMLPGVVRPGMFPGPITIGEPMAGDRSIPGLGRDPPPRVLQFQGVPPGDAFMTDNGHDTPTYLSWASYLVSTLQPKRFPTELALAALEKRITAEELITQALSVEPEYMVCIGIGLSLAAILPFVGVIICTCRLCGRCGATYQQKKHSSWDQCCRRTLTVTLTTIIIALAAGTTLVVVANEHLGAGVEEARQSLQKNVHDLDTFLRNTKMQLRFLVSNSLEQTVDAIYTDLDDIKFLLGRPLQAELAAEAQIEVALDSLLYIGNGLRSIVGRMQMLEEVRVQAVSRTNELDRRLRELRADIELFVSRCTSEEDGNLCKTLDTNGMEIAIQFDSFSFNDQLRLMNNVESMNLTEAARRARAEFENIPDYVETTTKSAREDVKREVREFRSTLYNRIRGLDDMAYDLEVGTRDLTYQVDDMTAKIKGYNQYTWYTGIGVSICLGLVVLLLLMGGFCGCCTYHKDLPPSERSCASNSSGQTLLTSVFFMFFLSGILWIVAVVLFIIGAHAYAFVCRPLYEESGYSSLTYLLDDSGLIYPSGPLLSNVVHPGRDVRLNFGRVIEQCQEGQASYQVFKLNYFFDVEKEVDYRTTLDLRGVLGNIKVNLSHVQLLSAEAEENLSNFLKSIKIDMQPYRYEVEKPLVRKNMPALVEQMQNVAGQMRSVTASSELFKLISRTRNLIKNVIYPLEKRKEDVAYQVATLDMEVMPLQRQINQSAGHLRTIQYFINNHGSSLAETKVKAYTDRILSYVRQYSDHVRNQALRQVAPCSALWNVFDSARGVTCNGIIDPLNAFWLATAWCLILFIPGIAVVLVLSKYYLRMDDDDDTLPLHSGMVRGSPTSDKFPSSENWGANVRHTHHHTSHSHMHHAHHHHHRHGDREKHW